MIRSPNPRLQRTRWRAPLSRKPLGGRILEVALSAIVLAEAGCLANPKPSFLPQPEFQLTGYWLRDGYMEGSAILLSTPLDGRYPVRFSYAGCVESDVKHISAKFDAGYLKLSESVREYAGESYDRLALYQQGQESYLTNLLQFKDPKFKDWQELAFRRLSTIP